MSNNDRTSVTVSKDTKDKLVRVQSYSAFKNGGKKLNLGQVIDKLVEEKLNRIK